MEEPFDPRHSQRNIMPQKRVGTPPPAVALRPKCPGCGKHLRPVIDVIEWGSYVNGSPRIVAWSGRYHSYGFFCTLRCGCKFANRVVREKLEARKTK